MRSFHLEMYIIHNNTSELRIVLKTLKYCQKHFVLRDDKILGNKNDAIYTKSMFPQPSTPSVPCDSRFFHGYGCSNRMAPVSVLCLNNPTN